MTGTRPIRKEACTLIKSFANPKKMLPKAPFPLKRKGPNDDDDDRNLKEQTKWIRQTKLACSRSYANFV